MNTSDKVWSPQKITNDRRYTDETYTDSEWHMSKSISISTLLAIVILFVGAIIGYTENMSRISAIETQLTAVTEDRIHRTTVLEMFKIRDLEISHLARKIEGLRTAMEKTNDKIDRSNDILLKIYARMPTGKD